MNIELEDFSLCHIGRQFREFDSAVHDNRTRLTPYFWWAGENKITQFKFIFYTIVAEKMSRILSDLPYNKKFIIRNNGKFAGIIGLDNVSQCSPRTELWIFVTRESAGQQIASNAIKLAEKYAQEKHINKIYARTKVKNTASQRMLAANGYDRTYSDTDSPSEIMWHKLLNNKSY